MMEQNNSISIPVLPGMRDDLEPHTAPPGTIALARNVRFPSPGVVQSRRGYAVISTATDANVTYANMLDTDQGPDFLHAVDGGFIFGAAGFGFRYDGAKDLVYSTGSYSTAQPRGIFDTITREGLTPITSTIDIPWPLSCAVASGLVAICHAVGNGQPLNSSIVMGNQRDVTDPGATAGAVVRVMTEGGAPITTAYWDDMPSAMVVEDSGNVFVVVYQDGTDLRIRRIDADGVAAASVSIGTLSASTCFYAACVVPTLGWAVAYQSANNTITIKTLTGSTTITTQTITITAGNDAPISIYADASNVYVGWALRGGASYDSQARVYDHGLNLTSGGTVAMLVLGAANAYLGPPLFGSSANPSRAVALVAYSQGGSGDVASAYTRAFELAATGGLVTGADNLAVTPLSAPFNNGMWWARHMTKTQYGHQTQRAVLLDFQETRAALYSDSTTQLQYPKVALVGDNFAFTFGNAAGVAVPCAVYLQHVHAPAQLSSGEWLMGIPRLVRAEDTYGDVGYLPLCEWLKFATGCEQQAKRLGDDVLVSGSLVYATYSLGTRQYDNTGNVLARQSQGLDCGFINPPSLYAGGSHSGSAGDLALMTGYTYRAVLEVIDSRGRRHRSAPSYPHELFTTGADTAILVNFQCWPLLLRQFFLQPANSRIVVHLYRTIGGGGANYQRCTPPMGASVVYTTGLASFIDKLGDTDLAAREYLYTDGGVLQNDHPPSCRFIAVTEDRVWLAGLWSTDQAQSSKILVPGEPVQFSDLDSFKTYLPDSKAITGIASQDGILIIFATDSVYVQQGLGPNDQGQGAWAQPHCISKSTGCIDWRSIVETSIGVFYQSERGIMLVPRGAGEPVFIGGPVQNLLLTLGGTVTGAAVCNTSDGVTVRFCTPGGTLIYDLETQSWSYDTPSGSTVHTKVCDAESGPTYARKTITSAIGFDQEQSALTTDDGTAIASYVEWCPVHPNGKLAGWNTFTGAITAFGKLDGVAFPADALTVACNVDSDATNSVTKTTMTGMGDLDYRRLQLAATRQACSATLSIAPAGAPWRFVGWTLELENLPGTRNTPQVENY